MRPVGLILTILASSGCGCVASSTSGSMVDLHVRAKETTEYTVSMDLPSGRVKTDSGALDYFAIFVEQPMDGASIQRTYEAGWIDTSRGRARLDGAVVLFSVDKSGRRSLKNPESVPEHLRNTVSHRLSARDVWALLQRTDASPEQSVTVTRQDLERGQLALLVGLPEEEIVEVGGATLERLTATRWTVRFTFLRSGVPGYESTIELTEPVRYDGRLEIQSGGRDRMRMSFDYTRILKGVVAENESIKAQMSMHVLGYAELWVD